MTDRGPRQLLLLTAVAAILSTVACLDGPGYKLVPPPPELNCAEVYSGQSLVVSATRGSGLTLSVEIRHDYEEALWVEDSVRVSNESGVTFTSAAIGGTAVVDLELELNSPTTTTSSIDFEAQLESPNGAICLVKRRLSFTLNDNDVKVARARIRARSDTLASPAPTASIS